MTWFGDIYLPWITEKDTSITKDVVEKNFVDSPPQVFELTPDLENGTYSAILNEEVHEKNESFEEQRDAVLSMVSRHGTEFPFNVGGDIGYILVESANNTITPSQEIQESEIEIRYFDKDEYNPAVKVIPQPPRNGDFSPTPEENIVAFPSDINVVGKTPNQTVTGEEGDIDFYLVSDRSVLEYGENESDFSLSQKESICRVFDSDNNRVYSDSKTLQNGTKVDNSLFKLGFGSTDSTFNFYDGSWQVIGDINLGFNYSYAKDNENDFVSLESTNNETYSFYRGLSLIEIEFNTQTDLTFTPNTGFAEQSINNYYAHWQDSDGYDVVFVRETIDGDFFTTLSEFGIQNLDSSINSVVYVGIVPSQFSVSDYARYVYNLGKRQRTFTQP